LQGSALDRGRIDQLLHEARMSQDQRDGVAVIIRAGNGFFDETLEIARAVADAGPLPGGLDAAAMDGDGLELIVQPTDTKGGGFARDRVGSDRAFEGEIKHGSNGAWRFATYYPSAQKQY